MREGILGPRTPSLLREKQPRFRRRQRRDWRPQSDTPAARPRVPAVRWSFPCATDLDTRGGQRVLGVRVVHHLNGFAVTERCEVGAQRRRLAVLRRRSHDHDDLVARVHNVDQLADTPKAARAPHELERLLAIRAGARRGRVATVPFHVWVEELADGINISAQRGREAASSYLNIALGHAAIVPPRWGASL